MLLVINNCSANRYCIPGKKLWKSILEHRRIFVIKNKKEHTNKTLSGLVDLILNIRDLKTLPSVV